VERSLQRGDRAEVEHRANRSIRITPVTQRCFREVTTALSVSYYGTRNRKFNTANRKAPSYYLPHPPHDEHVQKSTGYAHSAGDRD